MTPVIAVPSGIYEYKSLKIMYACNDSEKDYAKIMLLVKLFENIPCEIFAVHFHFESSSSDNTKQISELKEAFSQEISNNKIHFSLVDTKNLDISLETFVDRNKINAVAFIAHKSNIFKSLFKHKITKNDFFKLGLRMIALHE